MSHPFINYDDVDYVTQNPHVQVGLSAQTIAWAFTSIDQANWHPLTWISPELDCQFFGLNADGHHLTSVLFHIVNVVLLFFLLQTATGAAGPSAMVAAAFCAASLQRGIGRLGRRAQKRAEHAVFSASDRCVWPIRSSADSRSLCGCGCAVCSGTCRQAHGDYPALRAVAPGLLAAQPHSGMDPARCDVPGGASSLASFGARENSSAGFICRQCRHHRSCANAPAIRSSRWERCHYMCASKTRFSRTQNTWRRFFGLSTWRSSIHIRWTS